QVRVSGGKKTAVAVIPATLLCDEPCTIENLPDIEDVHALADILRDLGAHTVQEVRKVNDVRFLGRVVDEGLALRFDRGQHDVDRRADGDHIKENVAAGQRAFRCQHAADFLRFRADGTEALQVLVHRPGADFTAAGGGNTRFAAASQQGAQQVIACTQTLGVVVGDLHAFGRPGIHMHAAPGFIINFCTKLCQDICQGVDIFNIGKIFDGAGLIAQQRSRNNCNGGIFAAADPDLTFQCVSAGDQHPLFAHPVSLLRSFLFNHYTLLGSC
ncbi:MAG: hypothetical protein J6Y48_17015, partial [Clostridia bacterium]|nr:hypothetical protein [Clostridia bacterium]